MLIVLNDVLSEQHRYSVRSRFIASFDARMMRWTANTFNALESDLSPTALLLKTAGKFFDLTGMTGYECWAHYGTRPDWHVDKDEQQYKLTGEVRTPLCSIVYYADVDVLGGAFVTKMERIVPATNRMLVFAPGIEHSVEPYEGTRLSIAINPWAEKPLDYV